MGYFSKLAFIFYFLLLPETMKSRPVVIFTDLKIPEPAPDSFEAKAKKALLEGRFNTIRHNLIIEKQHYLYPAMNQEEFKDDCTRALCCPFAEAMSADYEMPTREIVPPPYDRIELINKIKFATNFDDLPAQVRFQFWHSYMPTKYLVAMFNFLYNDAELPTYT